MFIIQGVKIPDFPVFSDETREVLKSGMYESPEATYLDTKGERVLELGVGVGFISTLILKDCAAYLGIEANPALIPCIEEVHKVNGVSGDVINAAVGMGDFYLRDNFWSSSLSAEDPHYDVIQVPPVDLEQAIKSFRPTMIVCDIEGSEVILQDTDLTGVNKVEMETHGTDIHLDGFERDTHGAIALFTRKFN